MGLFRRSASKQSSDEASVDDTVGSEASSDVTSDDAVGSDVSSDAASDAASGGTASDEASSSDAAQAPKGPFDSSEVSGPGGRVDLGAVWLPGFPGMELRMEIDKKTQKVTGVSCTVAGSGLQVQAFAAPRTDGIWDEIREEIAQSVTQQGGTADDLPGPFGRELLARLPVTAPDGRAGYRPARFVGVDGPRWFLRGVLTGKAAVDPEEARALEAIFRNIVVVRDNNARPPRDLLALNLPGQAPRPVVEDPDGAAPTTPSFDPLTRGPEITEIH